MEQYSDSELEFIRREICKKYEAEAIASDDIVKEIPQYPKRVGDEKFNFLSEYVENVLHTVAKTTGIHFEELDEFRKDNYRINHSLSATLKKLYCEQHYKKPEAERKTEQFKLRSVNRFYLYFSGKRRDEFWKEKGALEINKILCAIQFEIDAFKEKKSIVNTAVEQKEDEKSASTEMMNISSPQVEIKKPLFGYKEGFLISSLMILVLFIYYGTVLRPKMNDEQQKLNSFQEKIFRTPAKAVELPGLIGTWYSYNRTPETNEENKRKGTIFRGIKWDIKADKNGSLVFSRPTAVNENDGWIELINMQINFFVNVHPKTGEANKEQNFGFRHFICEPNKIDLIKADTLWCVCTSYIHKDGRLDDPLASREIMIRKKDGQTYPSDLMLTDSMPEALKAWLPKDKSYLKLQP